MADKQPDRLSTCTHSPTWLREGRLQSWISPWELEAALPPSVPPQDGGREWPGRSFLLLCITALPLILARCTSFRGSIRVVSLGKAPVLATEGTLVFYLPAWCSQAQIRWSRQQQQHLCWHRQRPAADCLFRFFYGGDLCSEQRVVPPHFALQSSSFSSIAQHPDCPPLPDTPASALCAGALPKKGTAAGKGLE